MHHLSLHNGTINSGPGPISARGGDLGVSCRDINNYSYSGLQQFLKHPLLLQHMNTVIEHLLQLISEIDPLERSQNTKSCLILTALEGTDTEALLPFLATNKDEKNRVLTHRIVKDLSVINARNSLFCFSSKEEGLLPCINLMYLLACFQLTRILVVVPHEQLTNKEHAGNLLKKLSKCLGDSDLTDSVCILAVSPHRVEGKTGLESLQNLGEKAFNQNKAFYKRLIKNKAVLDFSSGNDLPALLANLENRQAFLTSPKQLSRLYQGGLGAEYTAAMLNLFKSEPKPYDRLIEKLIQPISKHMDNDLWQEDLRNAAIKEISAESPFNGFDERKLEPLRAKNKKPVHISAIREAISVLSELVKLEEGLRGKLEKYKFMNQNESNKADFLSADPSHRSIMSMVLSIVFSPERRGPDESLLSRLSKLFTVLFKVLETVPGLGIREAEANLYPHIKELIAQVSKYINQNVGSQIESLLDGQPKPLRLLETARDIKVLVSLVGRGYSSSEQIKVVLLQQILFSLSWECFKAYEKVWSSAKKNRLMFDLLTMCQDQALRKELKDNNPESCDILKKAHECIGGIFERRSKFFIAIEFYKAGTSFSKVIDAYRKWFSKMLENRDFSPHSIKDVQIGIDTLVDLGLVEKSIEWCYKFYDASKDSTFIDILDRLAMMDKSSNLGLFRTIENLKFNQMEVIESDKLNVLVNDNNSFLEEWME